MSKRGLQSKPKRARLKAARGVNVMLGRGGENWVIRMEDRMTPEILKTRPRLSQPALGPRSFGTVLLVEDSRHASDAARLMLHGTGVRLRRVETLAHARRHLALYRPEAVMVDLGLPDGSGLDLVAEMRGCGRIVAISGDPQLEGAALRAGADRFLAKPFRSVTELRVALGLGAAMPQQVKPVGEGAGWRDDLYMALDLLNGPHSAARRSYALQFAATLAQSAQDSELAMAVMQAEVELGPLVRALRTRLSALPVI